MYIRYRGRTKYLSHGPSTFLNNACSRYRIGRLVRLIPDNGDPNPEKGAIKAFFNYRLPADADKARLEWLEIVEARHRLWTHISSPKKELIRSFLNLVNLEIVKRARPSSVFNFSSASIGNLFMTGYVSLLCTLLAMFT